MAKKHLFGPISAHFLTETYAKLILLKKPSFIINDFFRNNWKRSHRDDFWTVILQILDILFQTLQDSDIFASSNQSILAFVLYKIYQNKIPYVDILSFLKNSPWNLKFSYILILSLLGMNEEKWKKSHEIEFYWDLFSNSVLL